MIKYCKCGYPIAVTTNRKGFKEFWDIQEEENIMTLILYCPKCGDWLTITQLANEPIININDKH